MKGGKGNDYWKGKGKGGKGLNAFDGQAWTPQPQAAQQGQEHSRLMTNTWNGHSGNEWSTWDGQASNFGGLNLCSMTTNRFKALETEDDEDEGETMRQSTKSS